MNYQIRRAIFRNGAVREVLDLAIFSGGPWAMIWPPASPASGPISRIQSASAATVRWCSGDDDGVAFIDEAVEDVDEALDVYPGVIFSCYRILSFSWCIFKMKTHTVRKVNVFLATMYFVFACVGTAAVFPTTFSATDNARLEITDTTGGLSWNPPAITPIPNSLTVMAWVKISIPTGTELATDMTILGNRKTQDWNQPHAYRFYFVTIQVFKKG